MPRLVSVGVAVIALALTGVLTGFSAAAHRSSEEHLLQLQVRQAAAAVSASVPSIQAQIADALEVASATKANPRTFSRFFAAKIDPSGSFASASLWRLRDGGATELASTGSAVQLVQDGRAQAFFARVHPSSRLFVTAILPGPVRRIGYAYMAPGTDSGLLVYTESRLPSKQRVTVPPSSAFQDLNFALYLGPKERSADLIETSVRLPITGLRAAASVPIGDRVITLVGAPARDLTDALSAALPWIVLAVGIVLSLGSAGAVEYVSRRRRVAEELAAENAVLYLEQRGIAGTLQRALLPSAMPDVGGIEVGARYLPGVSGIDVGGDWYDVIDTADGRCIFVVGDVSGRGLHAATTMASLRYATRAYALEGDGPAAIVSKLSGCISIVEDNQFATLLVGETDTTGHTMTLASAGHLPPLLLDGGRATFVEPPLSPPVGLGPIGSPDVVSVTVPGRATLFCFTDGLVERRGEDIDAGLERLRREALSLGGSLEDDLDQLISRLLAGGTDDDTVVLALRWQT